MCRGKCVAQKVLGKSGEIRGKYPDWCSASVRLAEHEKSSCYLQAGVQWFEAEQRLTKGCSLDSIQHIYHLPLHQTFIVFTYLGV